MGASIDTLRQGVDSCDYEIMRVLRRRFELTEAIGEIKKEFNLPVQDETVEAKKIADLSSYSTWMTEGEVGVIISGIIKVSRARQYFLRVSALDPIEAVLSEN